MIRVVDTDGNVHTYDDDGEGSFETEDVTNNLVIDVPSVYAVFADRQWVKAEQDKPSGEQ